jgi:hypothetical protein
MVLARNLEIHLKLKRFEIPRLKGTQLSKCGRQYFQVERFCSGFDWLCALCKVTTSPFGLAHLLCFFSLIEEWP